MNNTAKPVSIKDYEPLPSPEKQYTEHFIHNNFALVLKNDPNEIIVGLCNIEDRNLCSQIKTYHAAQNAHAKVKFTAIDKDDLSLYLGKWKREKNSSDTFQNADISSDTISLDILANDAPIINLVNSFILQAYNENASDIHFDATKDGFQIRFRIDGCLRKIDTVGSDKKLAVASRIKMMAGLNIMEKRLPQDGRCSLSISRENYDIRVSILPCIFGESIVLRLLPRDKDAHKLDDLGFNTDDLSEIKKLIQRPHGLILATGPTGSGKTTTLHALLNELPQAEYKIITIEDPVEYQIPGITQVQINEAIGVSFEASLRRILRQDPDVIMIGEIRDNATAELAIRASLTGHLVLSSLHTNSASEAYVRLQNMGIESYLLHAVTRGIIGQRLVRRLCDSCKIEIPTTPDILADLPEGFQKLTKVWQANGCQECHSTGYNGRLLAYELVLPFKNVTKPSKEEFDSMLIQNAFQIVALGKTSIFELKRVLYSI